MPDIRVCSICHKEFDFEVEGFAKKDKGGWIIACSEMCVLRDTLSKERICCIVIGGPKLVDTPKQAVFNVTNPN